MKKNILFTLIYMLAWLSYSQAMGPGKTPGGLPSDSIHTLLWKISGPGLQKPSYLFGTMHILCADQATLSKGLVEVISQSEEIYFEIDISDLQGMMSSMKYMRMNDNKKLSDVLNDSDYRKVKEYFEKNVPLLPFSMLERFKPLLISSMIEENDMDCKATNGMEMVIMQEVRQQHKKINGLETAEFQAGLFDSIPYEKQARDLMNYLDSADVYRKMTDTLVLAYKQQDLDKIDALTTRDDPAMNNYMDLLLYGRNRKWVQAMKQLLPEKCRLFAVGAGHLPGKDGLIELLRKNGYTVSPVKN